MSDAEWRDDDAMLRETFGYLLRDHVAYQDGRHSDAPSVVFADGDYEVGDGTCGLHPDGKRCNEPAIIYARADALVDALSRACKAEAWNRAMVAKAASGGVLDGYREMGAKLAAAETRAEKAEAERDALREAVRKAEAALADIAEGEPDPDDTAEKIWCKERADEGLRIVRAALNREPE